MAFEKTVFESHFTISSQVTWCLRNTHPQAHTHPPYGLKLSLLSFASASLIFAKLFRRIKILSWSYSRKRPKEAFSTHATRGSSGAGKSLEKHERSELSSCRCSFNGCYRHCSLYHAQHIWKGFLRYRWKWKQDWAALTQSGCLVALPTSWNRIQIRLLRTRILLNAEHQLLYGCAIEIFSDASQRLLPV